MRNFDAPPEYTSVHIVVSGKVQGVGYRFSTVRQARELGINGWVRNLPNGSVEAVLEGDRRSIERMIEWCRRGSTAAIVRDVFVESIEAEEFSNFEIRY
jgi:acylphosphatase